MASATLDQHREPLHVESLPLIDLRLLSQSELLSLSRCSFFSSSSSLRDNDVLIPKIDRSIFNESAGSRKQTFSRFRLAPRQNHHHHHHSHHRDDSPAKPPSLHHPSNPQSLHRENSDILSLLKSLFSVDSLPEHDRTNHEENEEKEDEDEEQHLFPVHIEYAIPNVDEASTLLQIPVGVTNGTERKRKRGRPRKNERVQDWVMNSQNCAVETKSKARMVVHDQHLVKDMVVENRDTVFVHLIELGNAYDPFGEELRRRTHGMETADELLDFLSGLKGEWVSSRKKRKIVDASDFGNILPRGWRLMLSIKRKAGRVWLACRRYISPNEEQFASCKEVSSYLLSIFGLQGASQQYSSHNDGRFSSGNAADHVQKDDKKGDNLVCYSSFATTAESIDYEMQGTLLKIGSPGVVQKGGALKCHKCNRTFNEQDELLEHVLSSHEMALVRPSSASVSEEVIVKDGKYECQLCHKLFEERHHYNGHLGVHIKCNVKRVEALEVTGTDRDGNNSESIGIPHEMLKTRAPIGFDRYSGEKASRATAIDGVRLAFLNDQIKTNVFGQTYTDKNNHDHNWLPCDVQALKADRNYETLVEESSEGWICVPSGTERRSCSTDNENEVSTHIAVKSEQRTDSQRVLDYASVKKPISVVNNNLSLVSACMLDKPKFDVVNDSGHDEQIVGVGHHNTMKDSEVGVSTLFGRAQTSLVNKASAGTVKVARFDEVRNVNKLMLAAHSGDSAGALISMQQEMSMKGCLRVPFLKEQKVALRNYQADDSTLEEHKQDKWSEDRSHKAYESEQTYHCGTNVNKKFSVSIEESNNKSSLIGNSNGRPDADILTGAVHGTCLPIFSGNKQIFSCKSDVPGVCSTTMDGPKQKRGSVENLLCMSTGQQPCNVEKALNMMSTGIVQDAPRLEDIENSRNGKLMAALGSGNQPHEYTVRELMWKRDEGNALLSGLTDTSSRILQSSAYPPTSTTTSEKGDNELYSISSIEGLRPASIEHLEYNFLLTERSSRSEDSQVLPHDVGMLKDFHPTISVEKEALPLLPKIASRQQVATLCAWCRNEFHCEPVDYGAQTGSVGVLCTTCKAKFSGDNNFL